MAQLVARLVRNEKVGGSNPPSSTTGRHPIADVGFLYAWARWCGACWGYRTKRVGFVVTFRLVSAEKSVLKLVRANLKDGQNVLVL